MSDTSAFLQDGSGLFGEKVWYTHPNSDTELYLQIGLIIQPKLFHAL